MNELLIFQILVAGPNESEELGAGSIDVVCQKIIKKIRKITDGHLNNFPGAFRSAVDLDEICSITY
ncbi:MAG TPA: hypothetical protein VEL70_00400 [Candidatus Acidoferrum sp.]|nr:hypothetical protein [Candidatus Acidoferrum sp.]